MPVAYAPAGRQLEAGYLAVEAVGDLDEDPGAVAGVDLGPGRASMLEMAETVKSHADDPVTAATVHVHDERHPARVVLEFGAVQVNRRG